MKRLLTYINRHALAFGLTMGLLVVFAMGATNWNVGLADTGINTQINYQGKMTTNAGTQVPDGNWNFRFRIYDAPVGGTLLWTERWNSTTTRASTVNGVFSVALGSLGQVDKLSNINWNSNSLYLQIDLDADNNGTWEEVFGTRKRFSAASYAFNADAVDGFHATSTAAIANYLLALDQNKTLNLFEGGVSSTHATTTEAYFVPQGAAPTGKPGNVYYDGNSNSLFVYNGTGM